MQRAAILTATQVPSYDHLKHHLLNEGLMREGLPLHIIASTFAGLTTAIVTSPVDLIKTRVMNQGSAGGAPRYRSALHCAVETVKAEVRASNPALGDGAPSQRETRWALDSPWLRFFERCLTPHTTKE